MQKIRIGLLATLLCSLFSSCIQKELPNSEADILSCSIELESNETLSGEISILNNEIYISVKNIQNFNKAPQFTCTLGATMQPVSGTKLDFSTPQQYIITSESGEYQKTYTVRLVNISPNTDASYHFEHSKLEKEKYYVFLEQDNIGNITMEWASGNAGFALTGAGKTPNDFPTMQSSVGYKGKCAQLVTRSTGSFGAGVGMPIAAGNLFIGSFDVSSALGSPLKATKFGRPFYNIPTTLKGYYKYKAGAEYSEGGRIVPGKKDICNIYAVFYETDSNLKSLDGTNMFTHPNIYSVAQIKGAKESGDWIHFELPFETQSGKAINSEKLKAGEYNLALVFSSSLNGDKFNGAVGSTLHIDEVELLFNKVN